MLKISVHDHPDSLLLQIEGKLIHPWTQELERLWADLDEVLKSKPLCLNLCGTTFVDGHGMQLLRSIVDARNPKILADSPLTRQFAEQARQIQEI